MTAAHHTLEWGRPPVPVLAAPGVEQRVGKEAAGILDWRTVGDGEGVEVGGFQMSFSRTDHGPVTLAVRLEGDGAALGYSADSGPGWSLSALGTGLDLALCEATYTKDHEGEYQHMSARQAGMTAREAKVRRLVVTHRWPTVAAAAVRAEAEEAFGGPVTQAAVGHGYSL